MEKKRFLIVFLSLIITICPLSPALGAEFTDVAPGDWFAPYVEVCVQEGLIRGTGEGVFSPEGTVSTGEALVMAARVMWQAQGGRGELPRGGPAEELAGVWMGQGVEPGEPRYAGLLERFSAYEGSYAWDALFYFYKEAGFDTFFLPNLYSCAPEEPVTRAGFFSSLSYAAQGLEMEAINEIEHVPDSYVYVRELYEAGILAGVDQYGTFAAERGLTRAEAAAALARIAEPGLRLRFALEPLPLPEVLAGLGVPVEQVEWPFAPSASQEEGYLCLEDGTVLDHWGKVLFDNAGGYDRVVPLDVKRGLYRVAREDEEGWSSFYGLVRQDGAELVPCEYRYLEYSYADGLVLAKKDGEGYRVFDASGELLWALEGEISSVQFAGEGLLWCQESNQYGCRTSRGEAVIPARYRRTGGFSEGLACVQDPESLRWGYVDPTGELVVPFQYWEARAFSEGLAPVMDGEGRWGYIDRGGQLVIPCQFDSAQRFYLGAASVALGSGEEQRWGLLAADGTLLTPIQYEDSLYLRGGWAPFVRREGEETVMGYLSPAGEEFLFDKIDPYNTWPQRPQWFENGYAAFWEEGRWGLMDGEFQVVLPAAFDSIEVWPEGHIIVWMDGLSYSVQLGAAEA